VEDATTFVEGLDQEAFLRLPIEDRRTFRAVKNAVAEVGEAVKALPEEICNRHRDVDWRGLAGLRDIMIHRYFAIDLLRLWPVLREEFPAVLSAVKAELACRASTHPGESCG
jgi:uncharacterized protein with HEPN domain